MNEEITIKINIDGTSELTQNNNDDFMDEKAFSTFVKNKTKVKIAPKIATQFFALKVIIINSFS